MIDYGRTRSTIEPDPIIIDELSVWKHTNITEITVQEIESKSSHIEYEFDMIQYSKDEYLGMMIDQNTDLENQLTDTELALVELYEMIGG